MRRDEKQKKNYVSPVEKSTSNKNQTRSPPTRSKHTYKVFFLFFGPLLVFITIWRFFVPWDFLIFKFFFFFCNTSSRTEWPKKKKYRIMDSPFRLLNRCSAYVLLSITILLFFFNNPIVVLARPQDPVEWPLAEVPGRKQVLSQEEQIEKWKSQIGSTCSYQSVRFFFFFLASPQTPPFLSWKNRGHSSRRTLFVWNRIINPGFPLVWWWPLGCSK